MCYDCHVMIDVVSISSHFCDSARGGWKPRPGQQQKNKSNFSILHQEKLIAEKKREIEARLSEQAKMSVQAPSKPQSPR